MLSAPSGLTRTKCRATWGNPTQLLSPHSPWLEVPTSHGLTVGTGLSHRVGTSWELGWGTCHPQTHLCWERGTELGLSPPLRPAAHVPSWCEAGSKQEGGGNCFKYNLLISVWVTCSHYFCLFFSHWFNRNCVSWHECNLVLAVWLFNDDFSDRKISSFNLIIPTKIASCLQYLSQSASQESMSFSMLSNENHRLIYVLISPNYYFWFCCEKIHRSLRLGFH